MRLTSSLLYHAGVALLGVICLVAVNTTALSQSVTKRVMLECTNPLPMVRHDVLIEVDAARLYERGMSRGLRNVVARSGSERLPLQRVGGDGAPERLLLLADFSAGETRHIELFEDPGASALLTEQRAQAEVSIRTGARLEHGVYTGGAFTQTDRGVVPPGHTAHDGYFRYEGPGWESDRVAYRVYLDSRSRCDIFGKKIRKIVLPTVGVHDLVSDGKELYTQMLEWGMDIFKVGQSLGIGSPAIYRNGKVESSVDTEGASWAIDADGPLRAALTLRYRGQPEGEAGLSTVHYSIDAGSRLTRVDVAPVGDGADLCTGLAQHAGCRLVRLDPTDSGAWGALGLYGPQSLAGDSLGIALFFRGADLVRSFDDSTSHVVVLRPAAGALTYYFAAAWEQEPGGIRNGSEFAQFLKATVDRLSAPVITAMP